MKTPMSFLIKLIIAMILSLFILPSVFSKVILNNEPILAKYILTGSEVYSAIQRSNSKYSSKVVIFGDSVTNQLYPFDKHNSYFVSLACNQAISLAGHYILLENCLNNNRQITTVYLIYHPEYFQDRLNQTYTYNYFLKPFYTRKNSMYLTDKAKKIIFTIDYSWLVYIPAVRLTNITPEFMNKKNDSVANMKKFIPSDLSIEYLKKMSALALSKNIKFRVISPYISPKFKGYSADEFASIISKNNLSQEFKEYFSFKYLDDSIFRDGIHYNKPGDLGRNPLHLEW